MLDAGAPNAIHTFSGGITVKGGRVAAQTGTNLTGRGNVTLDGGYLGARFGTTVTFSGGLGTGANQIRVSGGVSGFSGEGGTGSTFTIGSAGSTLQWGTTNFNPTVLLLNGDLGMNPSGKGTLNNAIDLNGSDRTITSLQTTDGAATSGFTVLGVISNSTGTAGLTKTGTGNLILTANNTYNGATTISSAGLNTATQGGGAITLSGTSGAINNTSALHLSGTGTLRLVNTSQVNRFADSAAINSNGGFIIYENTSGANVYTETMGAITHSGGNLNIIQLTNQAGTGSQTLTFGGLTQSGTGTVAFSVAGTGPQASGNKNMIVVTGGGTTTAGQIIGPWATVGTAANAQTDYAVYSGDYVTAANFTANNVESTWTTTDNINFDAATTLTGNRTVNTLRYSGAAVTLALGSNNLETAGLLSGGTGVLTITGTGGLTTASGGGNLYVITGSQGLTNGAPITNNGGTVNLVKSGSGGTLVLNGQNTYNGTTTINAGILQIGTNGTANGANLSGGNHAGDIFIAGGATLNFQTNASQILSGVISGDGNVVKQYTGTLTLSGANTYTGKTFITPTNVGGLNSAGVLSVSSFNSVGSPMASSSLGRPTTMANGTIEFGSTGLQQGGTLQYTGTGETTDRVINFLMNGTGAGKTIDTSGSGLLRFTSTPTMSGSTTNDITLTGSSNGQFDGGLPFVIRNFTKSGSGTWTLGGPVGSTGSFLVSAGTLIATDPRALGAAIGNLATTGPTIAAAGTLSLRNDSSVTFGVAGTGYNINNSASGATINVDRVSGTGSNTITVGNLTTTSVGTAWQLNFTGANGVSLNAGTLTTPTAASGASTINNSIAGGGSLTLAGITSGGTGATSSITFSGTGNTSVTGAITQVATAQSLTKIGTGTLTLGGANTYTGATNINGGTLLVNGNNSAATGAVTVANTATLGGTGTLGGTTTVNTGGTIRGDSGSGTGVLTTRSVTVTTGGRLGVQFGSGTDASRLNVSASGSVLSLNSGSIIAPAGTLGYGDRVIANLATGTGELVVSGTAVETNGTIAEFEYVSGTGVQDFGTSGLKIDLTGLSLAAGDKFTLRRTSNDLVLSFTPVPEPAGVLAGCGGLLAVGVLVRRLRHRVAPVTQ